MSEETRQLLEQFGIALALGLLVGLQRQHSQVAIAGVRTFPLITLYGALAALLDQTHGAGGWILAAGCLSVLAPVTITLMIQLQRGDAAFGMTTEAAILMMFGIGAYLIGGDRIVAVILGVGVAVLLQFKPELHRISDRLGDIDVRAIMQFALITCIVLPLLPNRAYGPLNVLNPFETWLMVVLMVGISLGGYLIYKFFGRDAGVVLGGLLGGAISSTATTFSYARRTHRRPAAATVATSVIMFASTVVYARVLLEISVVAPNYFARLAPPVIIMLTVSILASAGSWLRARRHSASMPPQSNPTELKSAIVFALLYSGVLFALAAAKVYFDGRGLFAIAIISGLTDMDAITLSTSRMVQGSAEGPQIGVETGWKLIVVASMANLVFKGGVAAAIGGRPLAWRIALVFLPSLLAGGLLLWLWPLTGWSN